MRRISAIVCRTDYKGAQLFCPEILSNVLSMCLSLKFRIKYMYKQKKITLCRDVWLINSMEKSQTFCFPLALLLYLNQESGKGKGVQKQKNDQHHMLKSPYLKFHSMEQ